MSDLEILEKQISAQIVGMYTFDVSFTDAKNESFRLIESENGFYVWPLFCRHKKTTTAKAKILCKLADHFVANTEVREFSLDSKLTYDEFMDEFFNSPVLSLADYILIYHDDNSAAFARANNVLPQQVTEWKNKGFVVIDKELHSPRRNLEE